MRTSPRGPHYSWTAHLLEATATAQHSAAAQLPGGTPSASYSSAQQSVVSHSKQERSVPFIRVSQHSKSQQTVYYLSDSVHFRLPLRKCARDESREPANSAAALILASVITAQPRSRQKDQLGQRQSPVQQAACYSAAQLQSARVAGWGQQVLHPRLEQLAFAFPPSPPHRALPSVCTSSVVPGSLSPGTSSPSHGAQWHPQGVAEHGS